MAEMHLALALRLSHFRPHVIAIVAMKGIAVDDYRLDALAAKDLLKGRRDGSRART
jgi:hypothetical protein